MLGYLERTEQNEGRAGEVVYQYEVTPDPKIGIDTKKSIGAKAL